MFHNHSNSPVVDYGDKKSDDEGSFWLDRVEVTKRDWLCSAMNPNKQTVQEDKPTGREDASNTAEEVTPKSDVIDPVTRSATTRVNADG